jgi:hypothetical protein
MTFPVAGSRAQALLRLTISPHHPLVVLGAGESPAFAARGGRRRGVAP